VFEDEVKFAWKEAAQLQAADGDVPFSANVIIADGTHDLSLGNVFPRFLENDFSSALGIRVTCAFKALRGICSEERDLRVENVENDPSIHPEMPIYTTKKLSKSRGVPEKLQRIEWHDDERELPAEIESTAVSLNPADAEALAFRLPPCLVQHGSRDVEADYVGACRRQRDRHSSCAATNLQNRSRRCLRLRQVELSIVLGFERVVMASIPNEIVVRHVFLTQRGLVKPPMLSGGFKT